MPVCVRCNAISVVINILAPANSTNDAAICVTTKMRCRRLVLLMMRTLPLDSVRSSGGVRRRQARNKRQNHRRDEGQSGSDPEQARIDCQVERTNREARRVASQNGRQRLRAHYTERGANAAQQQAFGEQHAAKSTLLAPSAARTANSPSRRTVRARIRLATLEHAMMKTSAEAASRTSRTGPSAGGNLVAEEFGVNAVVALSGIGFGVLLLYSRRIRSAIRRGPGRAWRREPDGRRAQSYDGCGR